MFNTKQILHHTNYHNDFNEEVEKKVVIVVEIHGRN